MGSKAEIAIFVGVLALVLCAVGAYAYDSSQNDQIAEGVTIGGVDVGGLEAEEAKQAARKRLLAPLRHSLKVGYDGQAWELSGEELKVHSDIDGAVEEALAVSRDGGLPGRLVRYVSGGEGDERISAAVTYSAPAVKRFVREVAGEAGIEARGATVEGTGASLEVVPAEYGRKLRDNLLTRPLSAAARTAH